MEVRVMHVLRKLYCRTFQMAFRVAIPFLPYHKPELLSDNLAIVEVFKKNHIRSVLLVTDANVRKLGLTSELERTLEEYHIKCVVYDETVENPTTHNVYEARKLYVKNNCQALLGFGGGSAMDCAKAVGAKLARPKKPLSKMKGVLKVLKPTPPIVAVPTTAGTGSETTLASVIVDDKTRHKYAMNDFVLIPKYAMLDPSVTLSLPPNITATTGMDALTHAVEAYIGRSTTKDTRRDALEATRLIFDNLPIAYEDGQNYLARKNMLYASYLAGCAFTKSYVGYVHAIAHSLGGKYNTPHGLANAVILPYVLKGYGDKAYKKLAHLAVVIGVANEKDSYEVAAKAFIIEVEKLRDRLNIPDKLAGIKEEDIDSMAAYADIEANPLYPVPRLMDKDELKKFYYEIMEE